MLRLYTVKTFGKRCLEIQDKVMETFPFELAWKRWLKNTGKLVETFPPPTGKFDMGNVSLKTG